MSEPIRITRTTSPKERPKDSDLAFGNVFSDSFTYRLSDLRYAAGPGVRYNTPIGPIRVDVGFILNRRAGDDFGRVEFSIGQAF